MVAFVLGRHDGHADEEHHKSGNERQREREVVEQAYYRAAEARLEVYREERLAVDVGRGGDDAGAKKGDQEGNASRDELPARALAQIHLPGPW